MQELLECFLYILYCSSRSSNESAGNYLLKKHFKGDDGTDTTAGKYYLRPSAGGGFVPIPAAKPV
jgi:hypothetical protein